MASSLCVIVPSPHRRIRASTERVLLVYVADTIDGGSCERYIDCFILADRNLLVSLESYGAPLCWVQI